MSLRSENLSLRDILIILKKHIWLILIVSVLCGSLGYLVSSYLIAPKYQANATLIVNPSQNNKNTTITYDQLSLTKQLVGTYSIILKSDTVLDKVIQNLRLDTDAKKLAQDVTVSDVNDTEVIELTVMSHDPLMAKKIETAIIDVAPSIIIKTVKAGSVEIISEPKTDPKPVSPNILMNTAVALLAGIIVAVSVSFIIELLNNTFNSDDDIQKYLGYTVLGVIPSCQQKTEN